MLALLRVDEVQMRGCGYLDEVGLEGVLDLVLQHPVALRHFTRLVPARPRDGAVKQR